MLQTDTIIWCGRTRKEKWRPLGFRSYWDIEDRGLELTRRIGIYLHWEQAISSSLRAGVFNWESWVQRNALMINAVLLCVPVAVSKTWNVLRSTTTWRRSSRITFTRITAKKIPVFPWVYAHHAAQGKILARFGNWIKISIIRVQSGSGSFGRLEMRPF